MNPHLESHLGSYLESHLESHQGSHMEPHAGSHMESHLLVLTEEEVSFPGTGVLGGSDVGPTNQTLDLM